MKLLHFTILLISIFVSSCKVTDQIPESAITANNFFKTASDADNAINGCYDALQSCVQQCEVWGESRTDLFALANTPNKEAELVSGNVSATNAYASWNSFYVGINRVNDVIKNVPGITDPSLSSRKERILGEAYFLRALFYFYLTRTFENVPLLLQPYGSTDYNIYPSTSDRAAVFKQIEEDLKLAEASVPDSPFSTVAENKGKASKAAIRCTLADLYLWQKRYREAADVADLVVNSPAKYSLVNGNSYGTIFSTKNSSESILEIQFNYNFQETSTNLLSNTFLPLGGTIQAGNWFLQPSSKVLQAYIDSDLRRPATSLNTGTIPAPYRDKNIQYVSKYMGTLVGTVIYHVSNFIIYRLPEAILFKAEALNELGQTSEAIDILNQIRQRAGLAPTTATIQGEVRLAIENERLLEFAYEGKRYFDLLRTDRYESVSGFTNENWKRWPLPSADLIINKNLIQNSGY